MVSLLKNLLEKENSAVPSSVSHRLQLARSEIERIIGRGIEIMGNGTRDRVYEAGLSLGKMGDFLDETLKVSKEKAEIEFILTNYGEKSKWSNFLRESAVEKITSRHRYAGYGCSKK